MIGQHITSKQTHGMRLSIDAEEESEDNGRGYSPEEVSNMVLRSAVGVVVGILSVFKVDLE